MENNFYSQFNKLKEAINLSEKEKSFHRTEILKIVDAEDPKTAYRTSPYFDLFFFRKHFILASLATFLIFGTGLTIGAENSLPNEYLYKLKTKITEPALAFLTPTAVQKANLSVAFVSRRLQELSKVAFQKNLNFEEKVAFLDQFSVQVKSAQENILELIEEENTTEAAKAANNLQSVLTAHDVILKKIQEDDIQAVTIQQFSVDVSEPETDVNASLETAIGIADSLVEKAESSQDETKLDQTIDKQGAEVTDTLHKLKEDTEDTAEWDFNPEEERYIESELMKINSLLEDAHVKKEEGKKKEAFVLYNEADQLIGKMELLLEADQDFGVDVLEEELLPPSLEGEGTE